MDWRTRDPKTGSERKRIDIAKKELKEAIAALPKDGIFNIIFYSSDFRLWKKELVPSNADNKREAREWVDQIQAVGATNIYDPLVKAFQLAGRGTHDKAYKVELDTIFFLSDGQPNRGRFTNPDDILREIMELNSRKKVQIHTIAIGGKPIGAGAGQGGGADVGFMRQLAERTGGTFLRYQ